MSKHVLVVDDDNEVRGTLLRWLSHDGFKTTGLPSGDRITEVLSREEVDLFILDIGLPDIDGLTLTRSIRQRHDAGIIIVSGRGDLIDRVVGLEAGADDYITKPFEPREIIARVRSVLRRADRPRDEHDARSCKYRFDQWVIDLNGYTLEHAANGPVSLTSGEFALLREFVLHPNRVLSRDRLIELTAGHDSPAFDRSIDVRVGRLRRKLQDNFRNPRFIRTVRNTGYVFVAKPLSA